MLQKKLLMMKKKWDSYLLLLLDITFSPNVMSNLGLIAKANNKTVKYCDAIDKFCTTLG
jgi:hypothetical protein